MRVTRRIGLTYALAVFTVVGSGSAFALTATAVLGFVERAAAAHAQVLALQEVRFAAAVEAGPLIEGHTPRRATSINHAIETLAELTEREESLLHEDEEEEEAIEGREHLPRLRELTEQIHRGIAAGQPAVAPALERERLLDEWALSETKEIESARAAFLAPVRTALYATLAGSVAGLVLLGALAYGTLQQLRKALARLEEGAARIGQGDMSRPVALVGRDELATLGASLDQMMTDFARSRAEVAVLSAELRAQNERLREALAEAEAARAEAERSSAAKDRFLANMSHELRTPLNAILGYTELLAEELHGLGRDAEMHCQHIVSAGRLLLGLINDVLDLSKIGAGQLEIEQIPFDLDALMLEIADVIRPLAVRNQNALQVDHTPAGVFVGDPTRLRQIVLNLSSNDCKFTHSGLVTVSSRLREDGWRLEVRDSGIGIPKGKQAAVFEPFTQADASTTRRYGGTGLGLTIVRHLVEAMNGTIELESEPGRGTTFRVFVPSAAAPPDARI